MEVIMKKLAFLFLLINSSIGLFAQQSESLMQLTHQTKNISATVWNDGFIGNNAVDQLPGIFSWRGENGIWTAGIVYGTSSVGSVNGSYGVRSNFIDDWQNFESDFINGFTKETINGITFDQVSTTKIKDNGVPTQNFGSGFTVIQKSYSDSTKNFIFVRYGFENSTGDDIYELYVGYTTAWNIGNYTDNSGGIELSLNLTYACRSDSSGPYFGVVAIDSLYGCKLTDCIPDELRSETFKYISQQDFSVPTNCDIGTVGGTYIDFIAQDSTSWITFAYVAGDNIEDLKANALDAIDIAKTVEKVDWNITSVSEEKYFLPSRITLSQNYPNPFNPATKIRYSIPQHSFVTMKVYDILGSEVATLINEHKKPGEYNVMFDSKNLSSGIYFYQLSVGKFIETKKMLLLR